MNTSLLCVEQLRVTFNQQPVVDDISFTLHAGETFALVGESGSGKSITALSVIRLLPNNAQWSATEISLHGKDLHRYSEAELCKIRGRRIGFIFQDPMSSLNPVMTIGDQIAEVLAIHFALTGEAAKQRVLELLRQVELPQPEQRIGAFVHQLSGGQRQRVMIAMALAGQPDLLIADEPTTALDVTIQAQILHLLKTIQRQTGMTLWLISHDLALVSTVADRVAVMQQGKIVEMGTTQEFFKQPKHPYTRKLLNALPTLDSCSKSQSEAKPVLLQVNNFRCYYPIRKGIFKRVVDYVRAVDGVSFEIQQGKTLALVGESGCGKTTLGKSLLNLLPSSGGEVVLDGICIHDLQGEVLRRQRAVMQIVFQDPFSAMNPRLLIGDIIGEGIQSLMPHIKATERLRRVQDLLVQVGLPKEAALRYPHEFSGGQRQRICIARALAVETKLIVCDEPTSALDVSVQAQVINLLKTLQQQQGISYLFITHNLGVVAEMADEVAVMYQGKIIEQGSVWQVLHNPQQDYTKTLLAAAPVLVKAELN